MEFLELTFSRHDTCNLLCDTSLSLARSSPTWRYTGNIEFLLNVIRKGHFRLSAWPFTVTGSTINAAIEQVTFQLRIPCVYCKFLETCWRETSVQPTYNMECKKRLPFAATLFALD